MNRLLSTFFFSAAIAGAQTLPDGYREHVEALPTGATSVAVVPQGLVWFDGTDLMLQPSGQPAHSLLQFPAPRFGAFTRPVLAGQALLFGESSFGELWLVPLDGTPPTLVTAVNFPYDAAPLGQGRVLVSAKTGGFAAADNDLIAVNLHTGATVTVATLPGASGPVIALPNGDVVCATAPLAFPPPAGTVDVLRFSAAQWARPVSGGAPLSLGEATLLFSGIDTASHIAIDGDDDLLFVDWLNATVGEVNDLHGAAVRTNLLDYGAAALSPAAMLWLPGPGPGAFEPFSRPAAGTLVLHESDFFSADQLRFVEPRPARIAAPHGPAPAGPVPVGLQHAAPSGLALLAIGITATGVTVPVAVPGIEQVLRWEAALLHPIGTQLASIDAMGNAAVTLTNPGVSPPFAVHVQYAFVSASGDTIGATAPRPIALGQ